MEAVFVEKNGEIKKTRVEFESKERLEDIIQMIVSKVNRVVNQSSPIVDARMNVAEPSTGQTIVTVTIAGGLCTTLTLPANQTGMSASGTINPTYKTFYTNNFVEIAVTTGSSAKGLSITLVLEGNPA